MYINKNKKQIKCEKVDNNGQQTDRHQLIQNIIILRYARSTER